jgi:hypothetical protein
MNSSPYDPPKCPLHGQPMKLHGLTADGFETYYCIVTSCDIEIDQPRSPKPAVNPDPLYPGDPADWHDPEI